MSTFTSRDAAFNVWYSRNLCVPLISLLSFKTGLQEVGGWVWTGSSWLRIGTGGGHL